MFIKQIRALLIAGIMLVLFSGTVGAYAGQSVYVRLQDGRSSIRSVSTKAETVGEFLVQEGIEIGAFDKMSLELGTLITAQLRIVIDRAFAVQVKMADTGEIVEAYTTGVPLYEFVSAYTRLTGMKYDYDKTDWGATVQPGQLIVLTPKRTQTVETMSVIPFVTQYIKVTDLMVGVEQIAMEGELGVKREVFAVEMNDGVEISRELMSETIIKPPVTRIVLVGATDPLKSKVLLWETSKELMMNASAYTADYESTGKNPGDKGFGICYTGMTAQYGVVAVDPKVIPLYTKLFIEGYGLAIAGDIGGAIKGEKIDLYLNSAAEARIFGRRMLKVYILADQEMDLGIDYYRKFQ